MRIPYLISFVFIVSTSTDKFVKSGLSLLVVYICILATFL